MEVVELARESLNPQLSLLGVLLNLADMRTVHSREALASLKERFGEQVFDDGHPRLDRLRRVGRAGTLDPRPPPRPRRRLPRARRRSARAPARVRGRAQAAREDRLAASAAPTARARRRPAARTATRSSARPAVDLGRERLGDRAGLLVEAPHQHRRPGAGDRRAERAQLARAREQLERAREQVRAALLVQAVVQPPREQVPVPAREPERQQRRVRDVEDRVLASAPRAGSAARAARVRTACSGTTASASRPVGGSSRVACPSRADHEAAVTAPPRRCRDAPPARSRARAGRRRARTGGRPPSGPRRSPPRSSRDRPRAGSPSGS